MVKNEPLWIQICFGSYFEIECLRNDFHDAIIVETESTTRRNQYILDTKRFKLIVGKTTRGKAYYYDIPDIIFNLLKQCKLGEQNSDYNYWNYHSRRIFKSNYDKNLSQGVINYLRICKAKWIESLQVSAIEKDKMHSNMAHSYSTAIRNYI